MVPNQPEPRLREGLRCRRREAPPRNECASGAIQVNRGGSITSRHRNSRQIQFALKLRL
jgi:hypothetical protein